MSSISSEIIDFVKENDVKFIRLVFCDLFGQQKNIAIMAEELPRAFEMGISFDASAVRGFLDPGEPADLFLKPDSSTVAVLPWRPAHERVMRMFCTVHHFDGSLFEGDTRGILQKAVQHAADLGCMCRVGAECEFYLFRTEDGVPTLEPFDHGGYADLFPLDRGENIRRGVCLALEEMGIHPESSHHEQGPGQNEIDFRFSDILTAADQLMTLRSVVKSIAGENGLFASFLPKPLENEHGSSLYLHLSLLKGGRNLFETSGPKHSEDAESFLQGILDHIVEITAFLNPLANSYRRLGDGQAPDSVSWAHQDRTRLVRIPASAGEYQRMELRSPDPSCNPYLALTLLLHAGLDGVQKHRKLSPQGQSGSALPKSLGEALRTAEQSEFVRSVIPEAVLNRYFSEKWKEENAFRQAGNARALEQKMYFPYL